MTLPVGASAPCPHTDPDNPSQILASAVPGGGGLSSGEYAYYSSASTVVAADSGLSIMPFASMTEVVNTSGGAITLTDDSGDNLITLVEEGFYAINVFAQWNGDAAANGVREIFLSVTVGGGSTETAVGFNNFRDSRPATSAEGTANNLLLSLYRMGFVSAGTTFTLKYKSTDTTTDDTLAGVSIGIVKLA